MQERLYLSWGYYDSIIFVHPNVKLETYLTPMQLKYNGVIVFNEIMIFSSHNFNNKWNCMYLIDLKFTIFWTTMLLCFLFLSLLKEKESSMKGVDL